MSKHFSPSTKGDGTVPKRARLGDPERPLSIEFNFKTMANSKSGKKPAKVPLFFKKAGDGNVHVICGLLDTGKGAYFTPFRDVVNDNTDITKVFRQKTGCHANYVDLPLDHNQDTPMKYGTFNIQAIIFVDGEEQGQDVFLEPAVDALRDLVRDYEPFNAHGIINNYGFDIEKSNDTARYDNDAPLPLDRIITSNGVKEFIHANSFADELGKYPKGNIPPKVTKGFYESRPDLREFYFSPRSDGTHSKIAINNFGYPGANKSS